MVQGQKQYLVEIWVDENGMETIPSPQNKVVQDLE
jgi:hypothetical protein